MKTEKEIICSHTSDNASDMGKMRANATLIAAAPKMYEKLKELYELFRWGAIQNEPFLTNQRTAGEIEEILKEARGEKCSKSTRTAVDADDYCPNFKDNRKG